MASDESECIYEDPTELLDQIRTPQQHPSVLDSTAAPELCDVVEPDSDEEDEEPVRIHSNPTGPGGADDDILPISGLLLGRLQSSIQVSESGRYGEEEHIYQGVGLLDEERRDAELAQSSADYTEVDTDGRGRSDTVFEVMEPTDSVHRYSPRDPMETTGTMTLPPAARTFRPMYRANILRPPPLPPLDPNAEQSQRKAYAAIDSILKSEAAFLTSLQIAIKAYKEPLLAAAKDSSTLILDDETVVKIFGPVEEILQCHELFYAALTARTMCWTVQQRVGDIFSSSFNRKEVLKNYSDYVNNFAMAMDLLSKAIKKKPRFVEFMNNCYRSSGTSLSLQALLLKPIQRFPQFIMFLSDLIKHTDHEHPDKLSLQMALAQMEAIADFLNESKRAREQVSIVQYLSSRVSSLPFKLKDSKRWLLRQDVVTRLMYAKSKNAIVRKKRILWLFNNMIVCVSNKNKNKESNSAFRDFTQSEGSYYVCRWFCPLNKFQVQTDPDYVSDVWDLVVNDKKQIKSTGLAAQYFSLKEEYKKLEDDFSVVTKICELFLQLNNEYKGLTMDVLQQHIRVIQRKMAGKKEEIGRLQEGRLDVIIPTRDESKVQQHTYMFRTKAEKESWLSSLRYAKLKLQQNNPPTWVQMDADSDDDLYAISRKLPLYVSSFSLSMAINDMAVECAIRVGNQQAWFAGGDSTNGWVTVVDCISPCPLVLENFPVPDSGRIMSILYVPPLRTTAKEGTILPPSHIPTVWMGSLSNKIIVYDASTRKYLNSSVKFPHTVVCMEYFRHQVYMATADGDVLIFKRVAGNRWDLAKYTTVKVCADGIQCMCIVQSTLWVGVKNCVYFIQLHNLAVQGPVELGKESGSRVQKMLSIGSGVWVAWRDSTIELYHATTVTPVQKIEVKRTIERMIASFNLESKYQTSGRITITAMSEAFHRLWVGTSVGTILLYQLPQAYGIPVVSGKPYMATKGHSDAVRVIVPVSVVTAGIASSRFSQFVSDEVRRYSAMDDDGVAELNQAAMDDLETVPESSVSELEHDSIHNQKVERPSSVEESSPYYNVSAPLTHSASPPPGDVPGGTIVRRVPRPPSSDSSEQTLMRSAVPPLSAPNPDSSSTTTTTTTPPQVATPSSSPLGTLRPQDPPTDPNGSPPWDAGTFVRKDLTPHRMPPTEKMAVAMEYNGEEEEVGVDEPAMYVEPSTLLDQGLVTTPELIVQPQGTIVNTMMKVPGRSKAAVGGGPMYVLTAGRSSNPVQTTSISSTIKIKDSIARVCIVAYEIEESQVD